MLVVEWALLSVVMTGLATVRYHKRIAIIIILMLSMLTAQVGAQHHQVIHGEEYIIGYSGQGKPITAVLFGERSIDARTLVIVGNTHGGPEANTYHLANRLVEYFRERPAAVPRGVDLLIIPTINPDGLELDTRFNAAGVDLNRNMNTTFDGCPETDWNTTVFGAGGFISDTGGPYPDSEPETRLIRDVLLNASGAIFLHSKAGLVFPAFCEHPPSIAMAQIYAQASGYAYARYWEAYIIQGGMHDWAASLGIASITPELITGDEPEFEQNLAGVLAVLAQHEMILIAPEDHVVDGVPVPALIWRYWRSHGAEPLFGVPLAPAIVTDDGMVQIFTNARLEQRTGENGMPTVAPAPLGYDWVERNHIPMPETPPGIDERFSATWHRYHGESVFGAPLLPAIEAMTVDGTRRLVQPFERAVLTIHEGDGSVVPEPLGWHSLLVTQLNAVWVTPQIR